MRRRFCDQCEKVLPPGEELEVWFEVKTGEMGTPVKSGTFDLCKEHLKELFENLTEAKRLK